VSVRPPEHVAIIGAGPAGSMLAWRLARAGIQTTLIERARFPRVKVCGEFVSPAATDVLEAMFPPDDLLALGSQRVTEMSVERRDASGRELRATFAMPRSAWALSRAALDDAMLKRAAAAGASIAQPAAVRDVVYADDHVRVRLADGGEIRAGLVVHADGAGRHDPAGATPLRSGFLGIKCHLRVPDGLLQGVTIRACKDAYVGTIAVESGLATCALVARSSLVKRFAGDHDAMLTSLRPALTPDWREGDWHTCGVAHSRYIEPGHPRSLRIGNAAAAVDPIGGEGIGLALWSAATLGQLLDDGQALRDPAHMRRVRRTFEKRYRSRLRTRIPACRLSAWALIHPRIIGAAWPLIARPGLVLGPWYRLSGKGN
jgi:flavin-dependent dehydrogenase